MSKEDVLSEAMKLVTVSQNKTEVEANQTELVYMMGYNDGVLDLAQEVLDLLEKENAGDNLKPTDVPQDAEKWEEAITRWLKVFKDLGFIGDNLFDMMKPRVCEITANVMKKDG